MTAKKDLKRRIRARMDQTGEPYSVARREVLEPPASPASPAANPVIEVVEMDDITELGAELGFKCTISITHALAAEVPARAVLEKLRDILMQTPGDTALATIRGVMLYGRDMRRPRQMTQWMDDLAVFVTRVRAGIGGVSESGTMLAIPLAGARGIVMTILQLGFWLARPTLPPRVVLTTADTAGFYVNRLALEQQAP
jgi:hypothetical protein